MLTLARKQAPVCCGASKGRAARDKLVGEETRALQLCFA